MRQLHQSIASSMTSACLWWHGRRMLDYYKQHYIVDIARSLAIGKSSLFPETLIDLGQAELMHGTEGRSWKTRWVQARTGSNAQLGS